MKCGRSAPGLESRDTETMGAGMEAAVGRTPAPGTQCTHNIAARSDMWRWLMLPHFKNLSKSIKTLPVLNGCSNGLSDLILAQLSTKQ